MCPLVAVGGMAPRPGPGSVLGSVVLQVQAQDPASLGNLLQTHLWVPWASFEHHTLSWSLVLPVSTGCADQLLDLRIMVLNQYGLGSTVEPERCEKHRPLKANGSLTQTHNHGQDSEAEA